MSDILTYYDDKTATFNGAELENCKYDCDNGILTVWADRIIAEYASWRIYDKKELDKIEEKYIEKDIFGRKYVSGWFHFKERTKFYAVTSNWTLFLR
jgi:hypothetical protein